MQWLPYLGPESMAFSVLISVYMSPFTGGATGLPSTTEPSGAASGMVCLVLSSTNPYLPSARPACTLDAAAAAAAWEAALVVSAAARSSATSRSSSNTPVHKCVYQNTVLIVLG